MYVCMELRKTFATEASKFCSLRLCDTSMTVKFIKLFGPTAGMPSLEKLQEVSTTAY